MPIRVTSLLAHLPLNCVFKFSSQTTLEENSVVHVGDGHEPLSESSLANNVHDLCFAVLIKVSENLGFTGSAAICLQVALKQQVRSELFEQILEVVVQFVLLFDELLDSDIR